MEGERLTSCIKRWEAVFRRERGKSIPDRATREGQSVPAFTERMKRSPKRYRARVHGTHGNEVSTSRVVSKSRGVRYERFKKYFETC